jgi:beta-glucosidase
MMDYDIRHGRTYMYAKDKPLYAFGYGLSYTSFAYESLSLSAPRANGEGKVAVTVKVKNTGIRASDEVVQMYVQHLGSAVERPQLELKGFERVHIEPGAEKNVVLELNSRDLAYWDSARHAWRVEKELVRILATLQIENASEYKP